MMTQKKSNVGLFRTYKYKADVIANIIRLIVVCTA